MDRVPASVGVTAMEYLKVWNYSGGENSLSLSQYVYLLKCDSCLCVSLTFMKFKLLYVPQIQSSYTRYSACLYTKLFTQVSSTFVCVKLHVRGFVHHSTIHKKKFIKMRQCINILLFYIYMKLNMFRETPPIIRSLKMHWQPLVFHTWKVVGRVDGGLWQTRHVQQPFTYKKPEAASAVLGSWLWAVCRPKHVELHINVE
jgi:hypothetical protein